MNSQADATREKDIWKLRFQGVLDLCTSLYWQEDATSFYQIIADHLHIMTEADNVNIRLLSSTQDSFVIFATCGDADRTLLGEYNVLSASAGRMPKLMKTQKPIIFDFSNPQSGDIEWRRGAQDGYRTAVTLPLANAGSIIGVCDLLYHEERCWDEEDLEWLADLGRLIGVIIGNALLADIQIGMRLLDERRRLGAEIHDSLAQVVNLIAFEAGNIRQSREDGDEELVGSQLARLTEASDCAVKLLRNEMAQLYENPIDSSLTVDDIKSYGEDFARLWGLDFSATFKSGRDDILISQHVSIQLIRIINEALVNIVRHSGASAIELAFEEKAGSLSITVSDNGCGFDPNATEANRMGLRTMRERAQSINGEIIVTSEAGKGTKVALQVPHVI